MNFFRGMSHEVKSLCLTSSRHEISTPRVDNKIYHTFAHYAASQMFNGENVILEYEKIRINNNIDFEEVEF